MLRLRDVAYTSQCDGQRPKCGRCTGYGYACVYSSGRLRRRIAETTVQGDALPSTPQTVADLRNFVNEYEDLVQRLLSHVACKDLQQEAQSSHEAIKQKVNEAVDDIASLFPSSTPDLCFPPAASSGQSQDTPGSSPESQRYLGEVSDVHFFNLIKQLLQTREVSAVDPSFGFDNYEQEGEMRPGAMTAGSLAELPSLEEASRFVEVYFSTVHLAYPFLLRSSFKDLNRFRQPARASRGVDKTELAIFCQSTGIAGASAMMANHTRCSLRNRGILYIIPRAGQGARTTSRSLFPVVDYTRCQVRALHKPGFAAPSAVLLFSRRLQDRQVRQQAELSSRECCP